MTLKETLSALEALGNEKMRAHHIKFGATGREQFGVKMGDIRTVAKKTKADHALALELWGTENIDARFLATLIMDPKKLSPGELTRLVESETYPAVADWLSSYVIKQYPDTEPLRQQWMQSKDTMCLRAGWSLTAGCIARDPGRVDIPALLDRIEKEMPRAAPQAQWTMNTALAYIGIHHPEHRKRALELGEKMGIYRDYPVSKGCTSPFAPAWINEMVKRQGS